MRSGAEIVRLLASWYEGYVLSESQAMYDEAVRLIDEALTERPAVSPTHPRIESPRALPGGPGGASRGGGEALREARRIARHPGHEPDCMGCSVVAENVAAALGGGGEAASAPAGGDDELCCAADGWPGMRHAINCRNAPAPAPASAAPPGRATVEPRGDERPDASDAVGGAESANG